MGCLHACTKSWCISSVVHADPDTAILFRAAAAGTGASVLSIPSPVHHQQPLGTSTPFNTPYDGWWGECFFPLAMLEFISIVISRTSAQAQSLMHVWCHFQQKIPAWRKPTWSTVEWCTPRNHPLLRYINLPHSRLRWICSEYTIYVDKHHPCRQSSVVCSVVCLCSVMCQPNLS